MEMELNKDADSLLGVKAGRALATFSALATAWTYAFFPIRGLGFPFSDRCIELDKEEALDLAAIENQCEHLKRVSYEKFS
jgi:hypothetical protein